MMFLLITNATLIIVVTINLTTIIIVLQIITNSHGAQVVTSEILMASEMPSCPIEVSKIPISRFDDDDDDDDDDAQLSY